MTCEAKILGGNAVTGSVAITGGSVDSVPAGISTGIKFLKPTVNDSTWTLIGGTVTGRRALVIQNSSAAIVYAFNDHYDALPALAADGYDIPVSSQLTFQCDETVDIYVKVASGGGSVTIKAMEFV
jgi:hypothetical protein